jgi:hypothetical protein
VGSFAFGNSISGDIVASASNAAQFGVGANNQADSLSVGVGPRLKGTTGAPLSKRTGDVWVDGNLTYVRSNSQDVPILLGSQGVQGSQGLAGNDGVQGVQGPTGNQGATGNQGSQGLSEVGTQGSQGIVGAQGVDGLQGPSADGDYANRQLSNLYGVQANVEIVPGTQGTLDLGTAQKPWSTIYTHSIVGNQGGGGRTAPVGSMAFGDGAGGLDASARGAVAFGFAGSGGSVKATGMGSFASGYAYGSNDGVQARGEGSTAVGYAKEAGLIESRSQGSFAQGFADANGHILAIEGESNFAFGAANGVQSTIRAGNTIGTQGAFAVGSVGNNGEIAAIGSGSFAFGRSLSSSYGIQAAGSGSMAFGFADSLGIHATVDNSWQFGPGSNGESGSLSVGTTCRLNGGEGAPSNPRNGDIWVSGGYVYIRSNGNNVKVN